MRERFDVHEALLGRGRGGPVVEVQRLGLAAFDACPFGFKVAFKNAAGEPVPGAALSDFPAEGLTVPEGAVSLWTGFKDTLVYGDNEGSNDLEGETIPGSTGGCELSFSLIQCPQ